MLSYLIFWHWALSIHFLLSFSFEWWFSHKILFQNCHIYDIFSLFFNNFCRSWRSKSHSSSIIKFKFVATFKQFTVTRLESRCHNTINHKTSFRCVYFPNHLLHTPDWVRAMSMDFKIDKNTSSSNQMASTSLSFLIGSIDGNNEPKWTRERERENLNQFTC